MVSTNSALLLCVPINNEAATGLFIMSLSLCLSNSDPYCFMTIVKSDHVDMITKSKYNID